MTDFDVQLHQAVRRRLGRHADDATVADEAATAVHEGSHVICARRVGLSIYYVNVTRTGTTVGEAALFPSDYAKAEISQLLIYYLSGGLGEKRYRGLSGWPPSAQHDLEQAEKLARAASRRSTDDLAGVRADYELLTECHLTLAWPAIQTVAIALAERGEIVGSQLNALMKET